jgi:hypothetical protein
MSAQGDSTAHWLSVNDTDFRGQAGSGDRPLLLLDAVARTKDLADRFAAGRLAVVQRVAHQVQIRVLGRAAVDLGHSLSVRDVPDALLNGAGYVRALCHTFDADNGFVTDLRISVEEAA